MKVLTATGRTQGRRGNDFDWCVEGELVLVGPVCRSDRGLPDGRCGCGRSFAGVASCRGTTTAMVREFDVSRSEYVEALRASLLGQGQSPDRAAEAAEAAEVLLGIAAEHEAGTVLERRLDVLAVRIRGGSPLAPTADAR